MSRPNRYFHGSNRCHFDYKSLPLKVLWPDVFVHWNTGTEETVSSPISLIAARRLRVTRIPSRFPVFSSLQVNHAKVPCAFHYAQIREKLFAGQ